MISGDGFLSDDGLASAALLRDSQKSKFDFMSDIISLIRAQFKDVSISDQDSIEGRRRVIVVGLVVRILEISEAALLVMRHGMRNETDTLLRVFLEAYFIFGNICSNDDFYLKYIKSDECNRLKLMKVANCSNAVTFEVMRERFKVDEIRALSDLIRNENIEEVNSYNYANRIGCGEIYDLIYRVCSAAVHSSPRSVINYFEDREDGYVEKIIDGPVGVVRIMDFSYLLINVLSGLTEVFSCHDEDMLNSLGERYESVFSNI